jgi:hypothetical protein
MNNVKQKNNFTLNAKFFLIFNILVFSLVVIVSTKLRPISDDYCYASASGKGVFSALLWWFQNWSGDLLQNLFAVILLGLPIIKLPWMISSAITFLLASLSIGLVFVYLIFESTNIPKESRIVILISTPLIVCNNWWAYWWINNLWAYWINNLMYSRNETVNFLAYSITFWQSINIGYVITLSLSILVFFRIDTMMYKYSYLAIFFLACGVGLIGLVIGTTLMLFSIFVIVYKFIKYQFNVNTRQTINYFSFILGCAVGISISFFSPGTQNRKDLTPSQPFLFDIDSLNRLKLTFYISIQDFIGSILHFGTLLIILTSILIGCLIPPRFFVIDLPKVKKRTFQILFISLLFSFISKISEAFNYKAIWHLTPIYMLNFLLISYVSLIIGLSLQKRLAKPTLLFPIIIFLQTIILLSVLRMSNVVEMREEMWAKGLAPIAGIGDLSPNSDHWINTCWVEIGRYRDLPQRGNY